MAWGLEGLSYSMTECRKQTRKTERMRGLSKPGQSRATLGRDPSYNSSSQEHSQSRILTLLLKTPMLIPMPQAQPKPEIPTVRLVFRYTIGNSESRSSN